MIATIDWELFLWALGLMAVVAPFAWFYYWLTHRCPKCKARDFEVTEIKEQGGYDIYVYKCNRCGASFQKRYSQSTD